MMRIVMKPYHSFVLEQRRLTDSGLPQRVLLGYRSRSTLVRAAEAQKQVKNTPSPSPAVHAVLGNNTLSYIKLFRPSLYTL
mgnify:CR=1 FL=1